MALSILDGNQSATTLSTIVTSGQHITAHTIVSLGTQAITDMRSAVSGSVVSISNFPTTQPISGTVTAGNLPIYNETDTIVDGNVVGSIVFNVNGRNAFGASGVTVGSIPSLPAGTNRIGVVTIGAGTVTIGAGTAQIGSVTVGNSVTISSLPENLYITIKDGINNYVQNDGPFPVSGNVGLEAGSNTIGNVGLVAGSEAIGSVSVSNISSLPDAGDNAVIRTFMFGYDYAGDVPVAIAANGTAIAVAGSVTAYISNSVTIASLPSISGTVTANSPNGSLTTRFGSVATANTAFATSAVTNSNRKYLLIQNITTASNVITVGIGFTPTTTQGIQLFAGAGLTFEGNYIPTGSVNLLSSVTASCYTILEA
jgi:hypothetical protein